MSICISFFDDGLTISKSLDPGLNESPAVLGCQPYYSPKGISLDYHVDDFLGKSSIDEVVEMLVTLLDRKKELGFYGRIMDD